MSILGELVKIFEICDENGCSIEEARLIRDSERVPFKKPRPDSFYVDPEQRWIQ